MGNEDFNLMTLLKACAKKKDLHEGIRLHAYIQKMGLLETSPYIASTLISMYARCGKLEKAQKLIEVLPFRDVVTWSALMAGYAEHGYINVAFECFEHMQLEGVSPNFITFLSSLKATSTVGVEAKSLEMHTDMEKMGLLEESLIGNILVSMYVKSGYLAIAQEMFQKLAIKDVVSWTALMAGYAQLGKANVVLDLFTKMKKQGIAPNLISFLILLSACSHAGLLEEGEMLFNDMCDIYSLTPMLEHYACMIDLFGRAGHFEKAEALLDKVAPSGRLPLFLAILGACLKWVNVKLGRWAFEQSLQLDEKCTAAYVCMEKIYAKAGMPIEANEIEYWRVKNKASKIAGCCWWTDANRNVHSFVVADTSHPESICIHTKLEELHEKLIQEGYSPGLHWSLPSILDLRKEDVACGNTEKLAVACALINTLEGVPICITMNMPMSDECHSFTLLISIIEKRRIQVNAADRIHIFEHGRCICGPNTDAVIV